MQLSLTDIDWGESDAKREYLSSKRRFRERFVSTNEHIVIAEPHHLYLWGERGIGKTAIAITEREKASKNELILDIDFEDRQAWTTSLLQRIGSLSHIQDFDAPFLACQLWYEGIWTEIMRQAMAKGLMPIFQRDRVIRHLKKAGREKSTEIFEHILTGYDECLNTIRKHGGTQIDPITQATILTVKGLKILEQFLTASTTFQEAKNQVLRAIKKTRIVIVVDSVDKWLLPIKHSHLATQFQTLCDVIRALVRATQKIYDDKDLAGRIRIKMFLPLDVKGHVCDWQYQHARRLHHDITWRAEELVQFISKRIECGRPEKLRTSRKEFSFTQAWSELFGETVKNCRTETVHTSIDYVLRHTLFRPRQLLMLCCLASEEALKERRTALFGNALADVVRKFCRDQYREWLDEFAVCCPHLDRVIHEFDQARNLLDADTLRARVKKHDLPPGLADHNAMIQFLYDIGFLGIHKVLSGNVTSEYRGVLRSIIGTDTHLFHFYHSSRKDSVTHEQQFVIHPFFYDIIEPVIDPKVTVGQMVL